ncbi:MAG: GNAT family N-acetyltransferase [Clostridia bacterium]|nr:GNAT family N-acetyltransferase [Clostridia bacterium]
MEMNYYITEKLSDSQIANLMKLYAAEEWAKERKLEGVVKMLKFCGVIALIDKNNHQMIAFARYLSDTIYRAFVYDVIVARDYRGLGYGRKIMEHLLEHEKIKNIERVELYCRDKNVAYYEKFGFVKVPDDSNFMRRTYQPECKNINSNGCQ